MSLLFRYLFFRHARLLLLTLALGGGMFMLTDMVDRLDVLLDAGASPMLMLLYYAARLPGIIAQILPAVFLLASVILLCLMVHNRESTALQAGGISPGTITVMLVWCALFWGIIQFGCSQYFGIKGEEMAGRIWQEQVRQRKSSLRVLDNLWFSDHDWIVSAGELREDGQGRDLAAYQLSDDGLRFDTVIRASRFETRGGSWTALDALRIRPEEYVSEQVAELALPLTQDASLFFVSESEKPEQLSFWLLGEAITRLRDAGSNVEGLQTLWHGKLAYAASLMVMALVAAAIETWRDNVYMAVALAIVVTFVVYVLTLFGDTMGQRGLVPPVAGAWGPQVILLCIALLRLHYAGLRR